jgi:predicted heme/steroid binding protein/uncharacterized membrane protein
MKTLKPEELARYNGENGRPIYIAHAGRVYDVSGSKLWKGGQHMRRHQAGRDLSADIQAAPHDPDVLERYPQVAVLQEEAADEIRLPRVVAWLLEANPFFRRHPHPMTVHFPIVFFLAAPVFTLLYLATGVSSFETTALHCLGGGLLFAVVAILTGLFTWWYNYMAKMLRPVAVKLPLSVLLFVVGLITFVWRLNDPGVLTDLKGAGGVYLVLMLSLIPMVAVIGWYGATMTFPLEKK